MDKINRSFTFPISVDLKLFEQIEAARGDISRSAFIRDAVKTKLAKSVAAQ